jgi:hypothetical protein
MTGRIVARIDRAGIIASSVCAVHCVVSPLLPVVMSLHGLRASLNQNAEWVFVGVSFALGSASLLPSYVHLHRRAAALVLFTSGAALMLAGRLLIPFEDIEALLVVIGALAMLAAHGANRWLCRTCPQCRQSPAIVPDKAKGNPLLTRLPTD